MTSTARDLDTATGVLSAARDQRQVAEAAEARVVQLAVAWAVMHSVESMEHASVFPGSEHELPIAGEGAPLVAEFCVAEFAAALGMSTDAGRRYLGQAVELRYRLPDHYARVVTGDLPAWKARSIAERTIPLTPEAATWVDRRLAAFAHTIGPIQLDRLLDEALARFMPEAAEAKRLAAAEHRRFDIRLADAGTTGVVAVDGVLDAADALDLETAVATTARELADLGSTDSLDVRRSQAIGEIARRDLTFDYPDDDRPQATRRRTDREVVMYVHLTDTALQGLNPVGRCDNTQAPVLTEQIRGWCRTAGTVIVKPLLDLAGHHRVEAHEVPDRDREQVDLRDGHCVFPHCRRRAVRCDTDHVIPWPDGPTCPCNLAPLCRRHHRHKTHGGWTNTVLEPGTYRWTSPHRYHYLVDGTGTTDITDDVDDPDPPDQ